jgi:HEPN domain-containing protein
MAEIAKDREDILPEQVCFHAQQAVEKALKAVLLYQKKDFPLTHDLEELADILITAGIALPPEIDEIGNLTPYAVETRYPGFWGEITTDDVDEAMSLAEKILNWASDHTTPK